MRANRRNKVFMVALIIEISQASAFARHVSELIVIFLSKESFRSEAMQCAPQTVSVILCRHHSAHVTMLLSSHECHRFDDIKDSR